MHICMLLDHAFPGDIRVEREAAALLKAGHQVSIVFFSAGDTEASSYGYQIDGVRLIRAPRFRNRFVRGAVKLVLGCRLVQRWGRRLGFGAVHVHDLPLAGAGWLAARSLGAAFVLDLHENYPSLAAGHSRWPRLSERLWRDFEIWATGRAAAVVTIAEENKARMLHSNLPPEKVIVVPNGEDPAVFDAQGFDREVLERYAGRRVFSYVGSYGPHRGLETALEAAALTAAEHPDFLLLIVGCQDDAERAYLTARAAALGAGEAVEVIGWEPFHRVPAYCRISLAGLIPHHDTPQTQSGVPNKFYHYLLAGRPLIVSDCRPLQYLVETHRFGLVFPAGDSRALAERMIHLLKNPEAADEMGRRGEFWARGEGSWSVQEKELLALYERLERETPKQWARGR